MRRILLFILPILIIISVVFTIFGVFQVRFEEEKLIDDLKRKAKSIAESMELSVKHVLLSGDLRNANYLVERFETRERLQGCVIYDKEGEVLDFTRLTELWRRISISLITLVVLIFIVSFFIQMRIFILPIQRLTQWFQHFQRGEIDDKHPIKEKGE